METIANKIPVTSTEHSLSTFPPHEQATRYPAQFYRLPQIKAKLKVSSSSIWSWVKAGKFPKPIKLSENCTAWNAADVEAWAQSRIDASKQWGG